MLDKPAPDIELPATGGKSIQLSALLGKIVVLYFYPKDNTPGCTTEAMQFRDHHKEFIAADAGDEAHTATGTSRGHGLIRAFAARGWFTYPSQTNFIFTEPRDSRGATGRDVAESAYRFLFNHKVLVRHFPSHALTAPFLRITVGTDDEMLVLNETFDAWLKSSKA